MTFSRSAALFVLLTALAVSARAADAPIPSTVARGAVLVEVFSSAAFHEGPTMLYCRPPKRAGGTTPRSISWADGPGPVGTAASGTRRATRASDKNVRVFKGRLLGGVFGAFCHGARSEAAAR